MHGLMQRAVSRVLERLLPEDVADAIVGDLSEEHAVLVSTVGSRRAARWYWGQIVRSVVPLLRTAFRAGHWVPAWVVGFVAYSFAVSVETAARAAVAPVATHTAVDAIPVLMLYAGALVIAAGVAERVRIGAALAVALVVALTAVVHIATGGPMTLWYRLVFAIVGPAAALAGGALFTRGTRRAAQARRRGRRTVA